MWREHNDPLDPAAWMRRARSNQKRTEAPDA
jgi:hypothetical protein